MADADVFRFDASGALLETNLPWPLRRGKVRDVYDLSDRLLIVSTDRISAFDWVLPVGIPGRGCVLTAMSRFWFERLDVRHHLIDTDFRALPQPDGVDLSPLEGRIMIARKAEVIPFECVVRGYLEGSGWREYQQRGTVCDVALPAGLQQCAVLPEPIFTPATKAETGHDENVSFDTMRQALGQSLAEQLRSESVRIYTRAAELAREAGIIIADTKFEWGHCDGQLILIDEVLTPDSSRFWPADRYSPGSAQESYDKQFVREWLQQSDWDKNSPPPALPPEIVQRTQEKYDEALRRLTAGR